MLSVKNVEKSFPIISGNGPLLALHKLSFTMKAGEFTCLIGPSGSGKTTLINLIAGFLQPTRGTILLQGRSIQGPGPDRGVVFQEAALFPWFTALQNVAFGLANQGYKGRRAREKALSFLSLVGLKEYASAYPHQLSGGDEAAGCPGTGPGLGTPASPPGRTLRLPGQSNAAGTAGGNPQPLPGRKNRPLHHPRCGGSRRAGRPDPGLRPQAGANRGRLSN